MNDHLTAVAQARTSFDRLLQQEKYAALIRDDGHLELLLGMIDLQPGQRALDIGTGTGYLAFPLAQLQPQAQVHGIDIAENVIRRNVEAAARQGLGNLHFAAFDGLCYPFPAQSFDLIVTRYALHHFPQMEQTAQAIAALLKPGGKLLIADPLHHPEDQHGVIDRFMAVKADGHMRFYDVPELEALFSPLKLERTVFSTMRFPFPPKPEYAILLQNLTPEQKSWYALSERDGIVRVGHISVGNLLFTKV